MDQFSKVPSFTDTELASPITEVAFALAAYLDDEWLASGTAVSIGAGILMTAKHVLEEYWTRLGGRGRMRGSLKADFQILARNKAEDRNLAYWRATHCWTSPSTDIAILRVKPQSEAARDYRSWRVPKLRLRPPSKGERVVAFGYPASEVAIAHQSDRMVVSWNDRPSTSVGEVTEVHAVLRDSTRLCFPCFQTNSRFDGGMSGGPIFNDQGEVCGLVCSTLVGGLENCHISYGLTLWPAMGMLVNISTDGNVTESSTRLLELANSGAINVLDAEVVSLEPIENGVTIRFNG